MDYPRELLQKVQKYISITRYRDSIRQLDPNIGYVFILLPHSLTSLVFCLGPLWSEMRLILVCYLFTVSKKIHICNIDDLPDALWQFVKI
jgi:hypothetical protein